MNKRNKIISIAMLSLLVVGLVSAGIVEYFGQRKTIMEVELPIYVEGGKDKIEGIQLGGSTVTGKVMTIENKANQTIDVEITSTEEEGVETSYVGALGLTKKTICDTPYTETSSMNCWQPTGNSGDTMEIKYTLVGKTFEVTGVPDGYTLIYYKDNKANADDTARLTVLGKSAVLSENMPHANDWNAGELADYCDRANGFDDYNNCRGAKLWVVPNSALNGNVLVWSNPQDFYFETDLIQYNVDGVITMYPTSSLTFNPTFKLNDMLEGTVVINTTVDNIE